MLRAVLFDLGGTLVEYEVISWEELEQQGWRGVYAALLSRGYQVGAWEDFYTAMLHASNRAWERLVTKQQSSHLHGVMSEGFGTLRLDIPQTELEQYSLHFYNGVVEHVQIYEDTLPVLTLLRQNGLKIGLISNTLWPASMHNRDLERYGLIELFDAITYSSEVAHTKPHPEIFLYTLGRLDVRPEEAAFVGDRLIDDVSGAQRVGMKGILKTHPRRLPVEGIVPDAVIDQLAELLEVLERLFPGTRLRRPEPVR
jgi:putative hydrolase of the HAD superfamily